VGDIFVTTRFAHVDFVVTIVIAGADLLGLHAAKSTTVHNYPR